MSRRRMEDLPAALTSSGWSLLDHGTYPRPSPDPFKLENEIARWAMVRGDASPIVELEFHAFGDLGQRTEQLNDILYCVVSETSDRLFFEKRQKPERRENLKNFVRRLNERTTH